ncbi:MAG: hypothetical protein CBD18_03550 [Opitutales bacterium TMED158]|nr:MAG: hypothetical protein CBD18_03550 [Opitutales bacterium TMED158]
MNAMQRFSLKWAAGLCLLSLVATSASAAKTARIFVDSEASVTYNEKKESDDGTKYETYVFIEGKYYPGSFKDPSLSIPSFEEVAQTLAENMKERNYYPSGTPTEGDLLVVVHYGVTSVQQDLGELFMLEESDPYADQADPEQFSEVFDDSFDDIQRLDDFARDNGAAHRNSMNNGRLGISRALDRRHLTDAEEFDLRVEMEDERYFIILMAYDYNKMRERKEKELLWTTRFSLPAVGTNFVDAYPALARAARNYYGTSLEKYAKTSTHFGTGSVDIGTLETVGVESEEDDSPPGQ